MVWVNTQCSNENACPGSFIGSMCVCKVCKQKREDDKLIIKHNVMLEKEQNLFKDSRDIMRTKFNDDPELFKAYAANVAMYLFDNCNIEHRCNFNHVVDRDEIATGILKLIFGMNESDEIE